MPTIHVTQELEKPASRPWQQCWAKKRWTWTRSVLEQASSLRPGHRNIPTKRSVSNKGKFPPGHQALYTKRDHLRETAREIFLIKQGALIWWDLLPQLTDFLSRFFVLIWGYLTLYINEGHWGENRGSFAAARVNRRNGLISTFYRRKQFLSSRNSILQSGNCAWVKRAIGSSRYPEVGVASYFTACVSSVPEKEMLTAQFFGLQFFFFMASSFIVLELFNL